MQSYPREESVLHKQNQVDQLHAGTFCIKNKTGLKAIVLEFIEACLNTALLKTRDLSQNVTDFDELSVNAKIVTSFNL